MAEQLLHRTDIVPLLYEVCGETVTQLYAERQV